MKRMMIDIETLSTRHDAVVTEVGFVVFADTVLYKRHFYLDPTEQIIRGRHIDQDTLEFWRNQSRVPRDSVYTENQMFLSMGEFEVEEYWANSPQFDCVILETLALDFGLTVPWKHYQLRDFRTAKKMMAPVELENNYPHVSVYDAEYQARYLLEQGLK